MIKYKGKAKCSCGRLGKWKAMKGWQAFFACHKHKDRLVKFSDPPADNEPLTEADCQTWGRGLEDES